MKDVGPPLAAAVWGPLEPQEIEYQSSETLTGSLKLIVTFASRKTPVAPAVGVLVAFSFVFAMSYATFWAIKATIGLRVSPEDEEAGLDIVEHGMYGYPEQFIPTPDGAAPLRPGVAPAPAVTAMNPGAPRPATSER